MSKVKNGFPEREAQLWTLGALDFGHFFVVVFNCAKAGGMGNCRPDF
jgi:hypothetical protein